MIVPADTQRDNWTQRRILIKTICTYAQTRNILDTLAGHNVS